MKNLSDFTTRTKTKTISVGNVKIGGQNKVVLQSMTTTKTHHVKETLEQIKHLVDNGCELVRVAIVNEADIEGLKELVKLSPVPLIADIHFRSELAVLAIKAGASKIRINPGNIDQSTLSEIVATAKEYKIPIRVGVNSGSLPFDILKETGVSPESMLAAAKRFVRALEELDFYEIVVSLKTSSPLLAIASYELAAKEFNYPLHLGITEAGSQWSGTIKSVAGLSPILLKGIGDTIRISLMGDPVHEIKVAQKMLNALGLYDKMVNVIACPTCGRLSFEMTKVVHEIEEYTKDLKIPLTISILGCIVNGPGEAKEADIGIAGGKDIGMIFKKGKMLKVVPQAQLVGELKVLIDEFVKDYLENNKN